MKAFKPRWILTPQADMTIGIALAGVSGAAGATDNPFVDLSPLYRTIHKLFGGDVGERVIACASLLGYALIVVGYYRAHQNAQAP